MRTHLHTNLFLNSHFEKKLGSVENINTSPYEDKTYPSKMFIKF